MVVHKKILRWFVPALLLMLLAWGAAPEIMNSPFEKSTYTFTVKDKWQSVSIGRSNISEHNKLELCLLETPSHCVDLDVRITAWNNINIGDVVSFNLERKMVYRDTNILSLVCFSLLFSLLFVGTAWLLVLFIQKLYEE